MNPLLHHQEHLSALCHKHRVESLHAFGSVLGTAFTEKSDIDLLVRFKPMELEVYFDNFMDFKFALEDLFQRPVDLVEDQAIRNPVFREVVDREKRLIYGSKAA